MPYSNGRQILPGGRDPDSKLVQWLALSRRMNPGPTSDTTSSSSSPSSPFKPSTNIGDSKPLHSCSSATSYFALLSANNDGSIESRSFANQKQHGSFSDLTKRDMDSPWVAWFTERLRQRQLVDMPDRMRQEGSHSPDQAFLNHNKVLLSPSKTYQLPTPKNSPSQGPDIAPISSTGRGTSSSNNNTTTTNTTTTNRSAIPSSAGTTSTWLSPSNNFLDSDIDSLDPFTDLFPDFGPALHFDPINAQANEPTGPCAMTEFDEGDLAWLEDQQLAYPLNIGGGGGESENSSPSKRSREEDPDDYYAIDIDTAATAAHTYLEEPTNKQRKTCHFLGANHRQISSPFSSSSYAIRSSQ